MTLMKLKNMKLFICSLLLTVTLSPHIVKADDAANTPPHVSTETPSNPDSEADAEHPIQPYCDLEHPD